MLTFIYPPIPLDKSGLATEAKQDSQISILQQIQTNTADLDINTDGLETLVSASNSLLSSIEDNTDGLETLITDTNSKLEDVKTKLDSISANTDGIESSLTTIISHVDQIETKQDTANSTLVNIDTSLSTVESNSTALNQKIAAALVSDKHDYVSMTYVGATTDIATVTYKDGGASGTTVATLTLNYDGSNRLTSVTRT